MARCDCYFQHGLKFLCYGTKEVEECSCGGDESKCDFYPEKRKQKMATEKRLIDADALIAEIRQKKGAFATGEGNEPFMEWEVEDYINDQDTVDAVEVVHGQWGVYRENEISKTIYCTNCWKEFYIRKKGELQLDMMPYCPNCGTRMDGGADNG